MIEVLMWGKVIITIAFFIVTAMLGGSFIYMGFKCLNLKADFRDMMGSFVAFLVFVCFGLIILLLPTVALLDQMFLRFLRFANVKKEVNDGFYNSMVSGWGSSGNDWWSSDEYRREWA